MAEYNDYDDEDLGSESEEVLREILAQGDDEDHNVDGLNEDGQIP